jgi:hypothetical protein
LWRYWTFFEEPHGDFVFVTDLQRDVDSGSLAGRFAGEQELGVISTFSVLGPMSLKSTAFGWSG